MQPMVEMNFPEEVDDQMLRSIRASNEMIGVEGATGEKSRDTASIVFESQPYEQDSPSAVYQPRPIQRKRKLMTTIEGAVKRVFTGLRNLTISQGHRSERSTAHSIFGGQDIIVTRSHSLTPFAPLLHDQIVESQPVTLAQQLDYYDTLVESLKAKWEAELQARSQLGGGRDMCDELRDAAVAPAELVEAMDCYQRLFQEHIAEMMGDEDWLQVGECVLEDVPEQATEATEILEDRNQYEEQLSKQTDMDIDMEAQVEEEELHLEAAADTEEIQQLEVAREQGTGYNSEEAIQTSTLESPKSCVEETKEEEARLETGIDLGRSCSVETIIAMPPEPNNSTEISEAESDCSSNLEDISHNSSQMDLELLFKLPATEDLKSATPEVTRLSRPSVAELIALFDQRTASSSSLISVKPTSQSMSRSSTRSNSYNETYFD